MPEDIHVVLSDTGWILETLASKLKDGIPNLDYGLDPDPSATIQYYMTYSCYRGRLSPIEVGYFAHLERDERTRQRFFDVSKAVDFCVCHSHPYEKIIRDSGVESVASISPGVDLDAFTPQLKVGIVGRTYHTGRKGEALMAAVMDTPGVEFFFTGEGWPGPALNIPPGEMPDFYRTMDYILVPSAYEGGPMSVVEALACGTPVIAPPIGWVPDFPHIEYETSNADDLRRVLMDLVAENGKLRASVLDRGWDRWVSQHARVFEDLTRKVSIAVPSLPEPSGIQRIHRPAIVVHGAEVSVDKGGPSVRAPATAKRLRKVGYDAKVINPSRYDQRDFDLFHIFNLSRISTCRQAIEYARLSDSPVVLSTIFLDPSERFISEQEIPEIFKHSFSKSMIDDEYRRIREARLRWQHTDATVEDDQVKAFYADVRQIIGTVDQIICLSEHERNLLAAIGAKTDHSAIVRNPVDGRLFSGGDPKLFSDQYGVSDYVLCVGRLEPRKNQITLLHALRDSGIPLVLIGHAPDPAYARLLRSVAGPDTVFVDRVAPGSPMLTSALAGARVFCLPSWSEGAPLAALEAGAAGCNMVLSDRSSEKEYFGEKARYCDPGDPRQMADMLLEAYERPFSRDQRRELSAWVTGTYSWEKHVHDTTQAYEAVASQLQASRTWTAPSRIYVDVTSGANRSGPPSGIARVEERYALGLHALLPGRVTFIVWNSFKRAFIEVSYEDFAANRHKRMHNVDAPSTLFNKSDLAPWASVPFEPSSILLVLGGAWIRNQNYIHSLVACRRMCKMSLVIFVHDVIQAKFKHWFPENIGDEFARNCRLIVNASDHIIVNSRCTLEDLREMAEREDMTCPPIDTLRFGDEIEKSDNRFERPQFDDILPLLKGQPFVLYVSALDIRKNHTLLYNIWERMLEQYGTRTPHLIMVGSKGWSIDHFLGQVDSNSSIKEVFHVLHGINDASLAWLYRNCIFTVYPSSYEGWGLPVAESLNYGKVCIAAQAGSVPEIAPHVTDLIDPLDFTTWYKKVTSYCFNPTLLAARQAFVVANYTPVTWEKSAADLKDILVNVHGRGRPLPTLQVGQLLAFNDEGGNRSREIKIGGWYSPEKDGTWSLGSRATLQFKLEGQHDGPMLLAFEGRAFTGGDVQHQTLEVACNGVHLGQMRWVGEFAHDFVVIPRAVAASMQESEESIVTIEISHPLIPALVRAGSTDRRELGVMVRSVRFVPFTLFEGWGWSVDAPLTAPFQASEPVQLSHRSVGGLCQKFPLGFDVPSDVPGGVSGPSFTLVQIHATSEPGGDDNDRQVVAELDEVAAGTMSIPAGQSKVCLLASVAPDAPKALSLHVRNGKNDSISVDRIGRFEYPPSDFLPDVACGQPVVIASLEAPFAEKERERLRPLVGYAGSRKQALPDVLEQILALGWSRPEKGGVWSDGTNAVLLFRASGEAQGLLLASFRLRAYRPMRVLCRVNKQGWQVWTFDDNVPTQRNLVFAAPGTPGDPVVVEFRIDEAARPADLEGGTDMRLLGLMVSSFAVFSASQVADALQPQVPSLKLGMQAHFSVAPEVSTAFSGPQNVVPAASTRPMLLSGWSATERGGTWTDGDQAVLAFQSPLVPSTECTLNMTVRGAGRMTVTASLNGEAEAEFVLTGEQGQQVSIPLPQASLRRGPNLVVFRLPASAQAGAGGSDRRSLGLYLSTLGLVPVKAAQDAPPPAIQAQDKALGKKPRARPPVQEEAAGPKAASAVVVDFARLDQERSVELADWFGPEPHGRWSEGPVGSVRLKTPAAARPGLHAILRVAGTREVGAATIEVRVDGVQAFSTQVADDEFHLVSFDASACLLGKSDVQISFQVNRVYNPSKQTGGLDTRDLGVHLRSLTIAPGADGPVPASKLLGGELLRLDP